MTDVGDPDQVKRNQVRAKLRDRRDRDYLAEVLDTYAGRAVLWDILFSCGIYRTSFTGDPFTTAFKEGARNMGLSLQEKILTAKKDAYTVMRDEAVIRDERVKDE
jgi:hypothetical protein